MAAPHPIAVGWGPASVLFEASKGQRRARSFIGCQRDPPLSTATRPDVHERPAWAPTPDGRARTRSGGLPDRAFRDAVNEMKPDRRESFPKHRKGDVRTTCRADRTAERGKRVA